MKHYPVHYGSLPNIRPSAYMCKVDYERFLLRVSRFSGFKYSGRSSPLNKHKTTTLMFKAAFQSRLRSFGHSSLQCMQRRKSRSSNFSPFTSL